ncbi:MAG: MotE family protein [Desulfuromonadales bacterium]
MKNLRLLPVLFACLTAPLFLEPSLLRAQTESLALQPIQSVEERRILLSLQEERTRLEERDRQLDQREMELKSLQAEVDKKLDELNVLRQQFEQLLAERENREAERLGELSLMYEKMDPVKAAAIISTLDEELAIGILAGMRKKSAGKLLNNMERKKAASLSRRFSSIEPE